MVQSNPNDKVSIDQVLQLVEQLSPEDRRSLLDQLTINELGHEVQKGIDAADRGELKSAEEVFADLKRRNASRVKDNS